MSLAELELAELDLMDRRRWRLAPLLDATGQVDGRQVLAEVAGVSTRTISRWLKFGIPSDWWADDLAVRLGRHPAEIWPDWFLQM